MKVSLSIGLETRSDCQSLNSRMTSPNVALVDTWSGNAAVSYMGLNVARVLLLRPFAMTNGMSRRVD